MVQFQYQALSINKNFKLVKSHLTQTSNQEQMVTFP